MPTHTSTSPLSRPKFGSGAGNGASLRITATIDTPVRVRNSPSPIVFPDDGDEGFEREPFDGQTLDLVLDGLDCGVDLAGTEQFGERPRIGSGERDLHRTRVGIDAS